MLTSMTGFGRSVLDSSMGRLIVEIQSINRKYLEVFVSLPREWSRFEPDVRKWVNDALTRGQVSVRVYLQVNDAFVEKKFPSLETLQALKKGWEKIAQELGYAPASIDLPFLLSHLPEQSKLESAKEEDLPTLKQGVEEALQGLLQMKQTEGKALAQDLSQRLKELIRMLEEIEQLAPEASKRMHHRLKEKMEEVFRPSLELEERLLREVALFAEKVDIAEEITRFRSHVSQFQDLLHPKGNTIGRKMDFLVQEMGREINTIGSKSSEAKIGYWVVEMKSELEKMREQIQNIE